MPDKSKNTPYLDRLIQSGRKRIAERRAQDAEDAEIRWLTLSEAIHAAAWALLGVNWQKASDLDIERISRWVSANVPIRHFRGDYFVNAALLEGALRKELLPAVAIAAGGDTLRPARLKKALADEANPSHQEQPEGDPLRPAPGPDPAKAGKPRQRAAYKGALAEFMARKGIAILRRMTPETIAADFKADCETKRPNLLPLLPQRLRSMEATIIRIRNQMEAAASASESVKTAGKGPTRTIKDR